MNTNDLPPVIQGWLKQILDPAVINLVRDMPLARIDVCLSAAKGKIRTEPEITLGGGPMEMISPLN